MKKFVEDSVINSSFIIKLLTGILFIVYFIMRGKGLVDIFLLILGLVLLFNSYRQYSFVSKVKNDKANIMNITVVKKEKYDSCRAAQCKYNHSYIVLQKEDGSTFDRKIPKVDRFNFISEGDTGVVIKASGISRLYLDKEVSK